VRIESKQGCKAWTKDMMSQYKALTCDTLTGSDYSECMQYNYKSQRKALNYACRAYDSKWDLYSSRQSPTDILGAYTSDFDPGTSRPQPFDGRQEVDGTSTYDLSTLSAGAQDFDISVSPQRNYISYTPDSAALNWMILYNNAEYIINELKLKNPSEHTFDGKQGNMEIQFWFTLRDIVDQTPGCTVDDTFRGDTRIALSYLLLDNDYYGAAACSSGARPYIFDDLLTQTATVSLTLTDNMINRFYSYAGSDTEAPYDANVHWLVSPYTQSTEIETTPIDWPTGYNFPDRPTPRAIFSEATLVKTNADNGYFNEGCPLP
jgi:hypothetical protein